MDDIKKKALIKKYKNLPEKQSFRLEGGRYVIGEEVDSDNRLWYVIRKNMNYTLELAMLQKVRKSFYVPKITTTTHTVKFTLADLTNNKPVQ